MVRMDLSVLGSLSTSPFPLIRIIFLYMWIRCSIWGELAEKAMTALHKGDLVKVVGTITFRTWHRQDGTSVEDVDLRVSTFEIEEPSGIAESVA